jgi:hypothetical protein
MSPEHQARWDEITKQLRGDSSEALWALAEEFDSEITRLRTALAASEKRVEDLLWANGCHSKSIQDMQDIMTAADKRIAGLERIRLAAINVSRSRGFDGPVTDAAWDEFDAALATREGT